MECVFLSLLALFISGFLVFCAKPKYKFILFAICSLIAIGAVIKPIFDSLMLGTGFDVNNGFQVFKELLQVSIDPFSAFIIFITAIPCFLFIIYKLFLKDYESDNLIPEILTVTLFSLFLITYTQNEIYFYIGFFIANVALLMLITITNNSVKFGRQLILCACCCFVSLAMMLLGKHSQSFTFNEIVNSLVSNASYSNDIFTLIFAGFGIPAVILGNLTIRAKSLKNSRFSELLVVETLFYSIYFYGLFRFIGMGAVPFFIRHYTILGILILAIAIQLYNFFKTIDIIKICSYIKSIHFSLVLLSILFGIFGYVCEIPIIMILGYSAAFIFFTNIVFAGYTLQFNMNKITQDINETEKREIGLIEASGYRKILPIGLLSYAGAPATLGFLGWAALVCALYFGIISPIIQLKIAAIILTIFVIIVFLLQNTKIFLVMKEIYCNKNQVLKTHLPKLNLTFALIIVLAGLFPSKFCNLIFVPVSFFTGGTKFYNIFNHILIILRNFGIYLTIFTVLFVSYLVLRALVLKYIESRTKV